MDEVPDTAEALWFHSDDDDRRGLHALVIGVSWYDNGEAYDLDTLPGAAMSAARFASWLKRSYHHPDVPLRSVRVLLSPVDVEDGLVEDELGRLVPEADRANVVAALGDWAADCDEHEDNVALLYAGGHGCYTDLDGGFVLLQTYGNALDLLDDSLNISGVVDGLAGISARVNYVFVDACLTPPAGRVRHDLSSGVKLPPPEEPLANRLAVKQFFAAAPGSPAWVLPDEHATAFGVALLRALDGEALARDGDRMSVSAESLLQTTRKGVRSLAPEQPDAYADAISTGTPSPASAVNPVFHVPRRLDPLDVTIRLRPDPAARRAEGELYYFNQHLRNVRFQPNPLPLRLVPGPYVLTFASLPPPPEAFPKGLSNITIKPGDTEWYVDV